MAPSTTTALAPTTDLEAMLLTIRCGHAVHRIAATEPQGDNPTEVREHFYRTLHMVTSGDDDAMELLAARLERVAAGDYVMGDVYLIRFSADGSITAVPLVGSAAGLTFPTDHVTFTIHQIIRYTRGLVALGDELAGAARRAVDNADSAQLIDPSSIRDGIRSYLYDPTVTARLSGDFHDRLSKLPVGSAARDQAARRSLISEFIVAYLQAELDSLNNDDDEDDEDQDA